MHQQNKVTPKEYDITTVVNMKGMMSTLAILLFFCLTATHISAQQIETTTKKSSNFITTKSVRKDTFPSGAIKRTIEITNKKSKKFELHEFYQKITTKVVEYHKNGKKKTETLVINKTGTYGEPCYEIAFVYKTYNEKGKTTYFQKRNCDCKKEIIEIFGEEGHLMNHTKKRIFRRTDPAKKKKDKAKKKEEATKSTSKNE